MIGRKKESGKRYLYPIEQLHLTTHPDWDEQKDSHVVDWARARRMLEHEDWLIIERVKILLTSQTLLSAAFYFLLKLKEDSENQIVNILLIGATFFGVFLAYYIARGMKAARLHQDKIIEWWYSRFNYTVNKQETLPPRMAMQPPIAGNDPSIGSKRFFVGYSVIAIGFFALWICALLYSLESSYQAEIISFLNEKSKIMFGIYSSQ